MLTPWKESYDKPRQCVKKQRDHFADDIHIVRDMVFLVVMYSCGSWAIKKSERWRIDAFELWYWRELWRVSRTATRSNQSILKEISPKSSLEALLLKLKLQYFGSWGEELTHWKRSWCWERLKGKGCLFASLLLGMVLVTTTCTVLRTSVHSSSSTLSTRSVPLNLFVTSTI